MDAVAGPPGPDRGHGTARGAGRPRTAPAARPGRTLLHRNTRRRCALPVRWTRARGEELPELAGAAGPRSRT
ncbi:hypothetical protein QJS66_21950 [Kocuria rhizophila]|nr:hypothetical protein QJS66_21950 [Kocuria rhizophila]